MTTHQRQRRRAIWLGFAIIFICWAVLPIIAKH
jgi:hypothetical protein